jgi:microcystin-dependent protein
MFGGNFAPAGWEFCDGRLLPISEHDALFNLIGTTYGGDGQTSFALPDLAGRAPVHKGGAATGTIYTMGQSAGVEQVTLTTQQMPAHSHPLTATTSGGSSSTPENNLAAANNSPKLYLADAPTGNASPAMVTPVGGSQPHDNMQPYIVINYIIALYGVYPTRT